MHKYKATRYHFQLNGGMETLFSHHTGHVTSNRILALAEKTKTGSG